MFKTLIVVAGLGCFLGMSPCTAVAGPYADDMARCLVSSTSEADRADLMRWMFSAMAQHPDLASMATISTNQRDTITDKASKLFSRLMFDSCKSQVQEAVHNEGPQTIYYAFQILGQVAMRGMMTDPHVAQALQGLGKGIDPAKMKALMGPAGTP